MIAAFSELGEWKNIKIFELTLNEVLKRIT